VNEEPGQSWRWRFVRGDGWRSTYTAWRGFLLVGTGALMAVFQLWVVAVLAVACGVLGLLYARRKYPDGARRRP
jgi:hypothetical protein